MQQELYFLEKGVSMMPIKDLIERSGVDKSKIVVMFDFDGTLTYTEKRKKFKKDGTANLYPDGRLMGQQKEEPTGKIRGGKGTREFLLYCNANRIPWFINTAAGPTRTDGVQGQALKLPEEYTNPGNTPSAAGLPLSFCIDTMEYERCKYPNIYSQKRVFKINKHGDEDPAGVSVGTTDNIISAEFSKEYAAEYILKKLKDVELFIFVDDNAENVSNIYNHMVATHPGMKFIGIVADPYVNEPTHLGGLSALKEAGKPSIQELSSEYSSGGRRSCTFRKSRKRRSSRKLRR
jgi:hypothetical protein